MHSEMVAGYFNHIGLKLNENCAKDITLLKHIVARHINRFTYQNTEIYIEGKKSVENRTVPKIDISSLYNALIINQSSGYCLQLNELLSFVLEQIGFNLFRCIAREINQLSTLINEDEIHATHPAHEILVVDIDDSQYLVDVGFGHGSLVQPIRLRAGEHQIHDELYRLVNNQNNWRLDVKVSENWRSLYHFDYHDTKHFDIDHHNDALFKTDQAVPIRDNYLLLGYTKLLSEATERGYLICNNRESAFFRVIKSNKVVEKKVINDFDALSKLASNVFHTTLPNQLSQFLFRK